MKRCKHAIVPWFHAAVRHAKCRLCGATLSLGPANDSIKPAPLPRREMANFRDTGWSWDPSRPISEQLAKTARYDTDAATAWRDWAKDNMISHEEYEASRDAESHGTTTEDDMAAMNDDRPSIEELQLLCHDDTANHDADLALAAPVLLEITAAAMALVGDARRTGDGYTAEWNALVAATSKVKP